MTSRERKMQHFYLLNQKTGALLKPFTLGLLHLTGGKRTPENVPDDIFNETGKSQQCGQVFILING